MSRLTKNIAQKAVKYAQERLDELSTPKQHRTIRLSRANYEALTGYCREGGISTSLVVVALLEGLVETEADGLVGQDIEDAVMLSITVPANVYAAAKGACAGKEFHKVVDGLVGVFVGNN